MIFEPRPPHTSIIPIGTCTTYNIYLISHCGWKKERRLERNILLENNPLRGHDPFGVHFDVTRAGGWGRVTNVMTWLGGIKAPDRLFHLLENLEQVMIVTNDLKILY